jgi:hypothetical protein
MYVMGKVASKDSNAYQATVTILYVVARVVIATYVMEQELNNITPVFL